MVHKFCAMRSVNSGENVFRFGGRQKMKTSNSNDLRSDLIRVDGISFLLYGAEHEGQFADCCCAIIVEVDTMRTCNKLPQDIAERHHSLPSVVPRMSK